MFVCCSESLTSSSAVTVKFTHMSSCIFVFTHVANILHSTYSLMHRVETKTFHFMEKFRGKQEGIWGMVIQFSSFPPLWVFSSFLWDNFYPLHKADRTIIKANSSWIPPCFDFLSFNQLSLENSSGIYIIKRGYFVFIQENISFGLAIVQGWGH